MDKLASLSDKSPWVTGYQKVVKMGYSDYIHRWWHDTK
jgi:hypothetical protein